MIIENRPLLQLYEVQLAKLVLLGYDGDEKRQRYFSSSEQLIVYLTARPDQKHSLYSVQLGTLLTTTREVMVAMYGPDVGDVACGDEVWYDSHQGKVVTLTAGEEERIWGG